MIQQVNLSRLYDTQTTAVSVDPIIEIGYARTFKIGISLYFATFSCNSLNLWYLYLQSP